MANLAGLDNVDCPVPDTDQRACTAAGFEVRSQVEVMPFSNSMSIEVRRGGWEGETAIKDV